MKIVKLSKEQFDKYAKRHQYRNYFQTSSYGSTMAKFGYKSYYLGIINNMNQLIGATLLIYKEVFMNNKIAFAPRGILFDYDDSIKVKELADNLKRLLGKQGFMLLRMDPYIPISIRSNTGDLININNQESTIIENLTSAGFEYKGKNLYLENENPRFEAITILDKDKQTLFEKFDEETQEKIKMAMGAGINIVKDEDKNIEELYEFIKNKKTKRFYEELKENFGDNLEVYLAKIDTEIFTINSRRTYEQEVQNNDQLAEKIQSYGTNATERNNLITKKMKSDKMIALYKKNLVLSTELLKKYPTGLTMGGCIVINYDNAAYIYAEGYDEKYIPQNPDYLLKWHLMNIFLEKGYKYINHNGVYGEFESTDQFNTRKLGYNSIVSEYIGEFDIILNNFAYNLYKNFNKNK